MIDASRRTGEKLEEVGGNEVLYAFPLVFYI